MVNEYRLIEVEASSSQGSFLIGFYRSDAFSEGFATRMDSKSLPKHFQTTFGIQFGRGKAFDAAFNTKTPAILEPKLIQNYVGSNKNKTKKSVIEIDVIF